MFIFPPQEAVDPVRGQWTGKLVAIKVYDGRGGVYDAMALQDWRGPTFKESSVKGLPIPPGPPILVSGLDGRILNPQNYPLNEDVTVDGELCLKVPNSFPSHPIYGEQSVSVHPHNRDRPGVLLIATNQPIVAKRK